MRPESQVSEQSINMDQILSLTPPGGDFDEPSSWPQWMGHFERFREASGLVDKDSAYQVNSLLYIMGRKATIF